MSVNFSDMNQRHLFLAYTFTLLLQFGYASWVALSWLRLKKTSPQQPVR